jgi:hypothetical protein
MSHISLHDSPKDVTFWVDLVRTLCWCTGRIALLFGHADSGPEKGESLFSQLASILHIGNYIQTLLSDSVGDDSPVHSSLVLLLLSPHRGELVWPRGYSIPIPNYFYHTIFPTSQLSLSQYVCSLCPLPSDLLCASTLSSLLYRSLCTGNTAHLVLVLHSIQSGESESSLCLRLIVATVIAWARDFSPTTTLADWVRTVDPILGILQHSILESTVHILDVMLISSLGYSVSLIREGKLPPEICLGVSEADALLADCASSQLITAALFVRCLSSLNLEKV